MNRLFRASATLLLASVCACSDDDEDNSRAVFEAYAANAFAGYSESVTAANALRTAIDAFVAAPSQAGLDAARAAWIASRVSYMQTEPLRFYGGPIDNETDGPEGRINGWPLDEAYIDGVAGAPQSGIINNPSTYPNITAQLISDLNGQGGEANLSAGYHAIAFLLWGQDTFADTPGRRPFTDYVAGGSAPNPARRGQYLQETVDLLISDLEHVRDAWAPNATNYRSEFVELDREEGLRRILLGMGSLSGAELSGERMTVAYDTKDQEDEHSCFSDTTLADLERDAVGIQNIYLGRYGSTDGPGLDQLVESEDPDLDEQFQQELTASIAAIRAIPGPFDQAILGDDSSVGRTRVAAAISTIQTQTQTIVEIATLLGVSINLEKAQPRPR